MFGVGFVLAIVGVWLVDSAVQGRHPITVLKKIIAQPANARTTLASSKGKVSPTTDTNVFFQNILPTNMTGNPAMNVSPTSPHHSTVSGPAVLVGGVPTLPGAGDNAGQKALAYAEAQIGKPYQYGKVGPNTFDCSGLMYAAWLSAGFKIPRSTYQMLAPGAMEFVARKNLQQGDIIFPYPGHCFMYVGPNRAVEAPHTGTKIHYTNIYQYMTARRPKGA